MDLGFTLAVAITALLMVSCRDRPREASLPDHPMPDTVPAHRLAPLDSALAVPGIVVEYHWEAPHTVAAPGSTLRFTHPATRQEVRLFDTVAFDLDGVAAARLQPAGRGSMVVLELTPQGAERLLHTTSWHAGERLGVLVNGHLVTLATVRGPFTNMLPVLDLVPNEQAQAVADRINAGLRDTRPDST